MPQRYERVAEHDEDESPVDTHPQAPYPIPNSPPPSFHSRASSPTGGASRRLLADDPLRDDAERTLADTFDSPSDDEDSDNEHGEGVDDRQRLMRASPADQEQSDSHIGPDIRAGIQRRVTQLPVFGPQPTVRGKVYGGGQNDGVFANLSAKPTRGEEVEEKPPSYEQAAADAAPPYWETTILAPGLMGDEVYVEGLPVGSVFGFVWNAMISMSFQLVGFLLTYLLHTTHAAKNGSRAGLGITLIHFGFTMKGASSLAPSDPPSDFSGSPPPDPNSHDFDPNAIPQPSGASSASPSEGFSSTDMIAYFMMVIGWFLLIKSICDYIRARRHEQLILQSPDRGLGVAVVAEGERPEQSV